MLHRIADPLPDARALAPCAVGGIVGRRRFLAPNFASGTVLSELRQTFKKSNINGCRLTGEDVSSPIGKLEASWPDGLEKACLFEVCACPTNAVVQPRLPASQNLRLIVLG